MLHDNTESSHCQALPCAVLYLQVLLVHQPCLVTPHAMAGVHGDSTPCIVQAQVIPPNLPLFGQEPGLYIPLLITVGGTHLGSHLKKQRIVGVLLEYLNILIHNCDAATCFVLNS